jgi:hypothetical protein
MTVTLQNVGIAMIFSAMPEILFTTIYLIAHASKLHFFADDAKCLRLPSDLRPGLILSRFICLDALQDAGGTIVGAE